MDYDTWHRMTLAGINLDEADEKLSKKEQGELRKQNKIKSNNELDSKDTARAARIGVKVKSFDRDSWHTDFKRLFGTLDGREIHVGIHDEPNRKTGIDGGRIWSLQVYDETGRWEEAVYQKRFARDMGWPMATPYETLDSDVKKIVDKIVKAFK